MGFKETLETLKRKASAIAQLRKRLKDSVARPLAKSYFKTNDK